MQKSTMCLMLQNNSSTYIVFHAFLHHTLFTAQIPIFFLLFLGKHISTNASIDCQKVQGIKKMIYFLNPYVMARRMEFLVQAACRVKFWNRIFLNKGKKSRKKNVCFISSNYEVKLQTLKSNRKKQVWSTLFPISKF